MTVTFNSNYDYEIDSEIIFLYYGNECLGKVIGKQYNVDETVELTVLPLLN
jgi:hypothetical protein